MGNWASESAKSSFDAKTFVSNTISGREESRSAISNDLRSQYSVVGINVEGIPAMREAIRVYVKAVEDHLNGIEPLADAQNAYKSSDVQQSVKEYIEKEKVYCINLTSQLLAFSDKLADVSKAWVESAQGMASKVNTANTTFSEGNKYQESMQ